MTDDSRATESSHLEPQAVSSECDLGMALGF